MGFNSAFKGLNLLSVGRERSASFPGRFTKKSAGGKGKLSAALKVKKARTDTRFLGCLALSVAILLTTIFWLPNTDTPEHTHLI